MGRVQYRCIPLVLLLFIIGGTVFQYLQHRSLTSNKPDVNIYRHREQGHRLKIRGFNFQGYCEGKKVLSIKADKFTLEKKKLGFFRLGFSNTARFANPVIDIYGTDGGNKDSTLPKKDSGAAQKDIRTSEQVDFSGIFEKEALPSFHMKRIASVILEPVCINLYQDKAQLTQITASFATIRLKQRVIVFKSNVRVKSGSRSLRTSRLVFHPESAIMEADGSFVLSAGGEEVEGKSISTNIFLDFDRM